MGTTDLRRLWLVQGSHCAGGLRIRCHKRGVVKRRAGPDSPKSAYLYFFELGFGLVEIGPLWPNLAVSGRKRSKSGRRGSNLAWFGPKLAQHSPNLVEHRSRTKTTPSWPTTIKFGHGPLVGRKRLGIGPNLAAPTRQSWPRLPRPIGRDSGAFPEGVNLASARHTAHGCCDRCARSRSGPLWAAARGCCRRRSAGAARRATPRRPHRSPGPRRFLRLGAPIAGWAGGEVGEVARTSAATRSLQRRHEDWAPLTALLRASELNPRRRMWWARRSRRGRPEPWPEADHQTSDLGGESVFPAIWRGCQFCASRYALAEPGVTDRGLPNRCFSTGNIRLRRNPSHPYAVPVQIPNALAQDFVPLVSHLSPHTPHAKPPAAPTQRSCCTHLFDTQQFP